MRRAHTLFALLILGCNEPTDTEDTTPPTVDEIPDVVRVSPAQDAYLDRSLELVFDGLLDDHTYVASLGEPYPQEVPVVAGVATMELLESSGEFSALLEVQDTDTDDLVYVDYLRGTVVVSNPRSWEFCDTPVCVWAESPIDVGVGHDFFVKLDGWGISRDLTEVRFRVGGTEVQADGPPWSYSMSIPPEDREQTIIEADLTWPTGDVTTIEHPISIRKCLHQRARWSDANWLGATTDGLVVELLENTFTGTDHAIALDDGVTFTTILEPLDDLQPLRMTSEGVVFLARTSAWDDVEVFAYDPRIDAAPRSIASLDSPDAWDVDDDGRVAFAGYRISIVEDGVVREVEMPTFGAPLESLLLTGTDAYALRDAGKELDLVYIDLAADPVTIERYGSIPAPNPFIERFDLVRSPFGGALLRRPDSWMSIHPDGLRLVAEPDHGNWHSPPFLPVHIDGCDEVWAKGFSPATFPAAPFR